jgi:hypothetical protein
MNYDIGQPFIEINFPSRGVKTALFRREDILRVKETVTPDDKPLITIYVKPIMGENKAVEWYFDGTLEELKKAMKTVYL